MAISAESRSAGRRLAPIAFAIAIETFVTCFDEQTAGDSHTFAEPATEIWAAWRRIER